MKRFLSMLFVLSFALSALTFTASASKVSLCDPQWGDIVTKSDYITPTTEEAGGRQINTGRVIDASAITASTVLVKASENTFTYREIMPNGAGGYATGGGSARFKNNFTWEFDFCFDKLPGIGDGNSFVLQIGPHWQNAIKFWAKEMKTGDVAETKYYLRWASGSNYKISGGDEYYAKSSPMLREGCTYHLKIETDVVNGKIYTSFTNPYVTKNASGTWILNENPAPEGTEVWTFESESPMKFTTTYTDTMKKLTTGYERPDITITAKSAAKVTLTNEKFYIDRVCNIKPELTVNENVLTATTHAVNITNSNYTMNTPILICAVYKLEDGNVSTLVLADTKQEYKEPMAALADNEYSTSVDLSQLPDGNYKVKTFVWNSIDELHPYANCLVEKTLTISGGTAALADAN